MNEGHPEFLPAKNNISPPSLIVNVADLAPDLGFRVHPFICPCIPSCIHRLFFPCFHPCILSYSLSCRFVVLHVSAPHRSKRASEHPPQSLPTLWYTITILHIFNMGGGGVVILEEVSRSFAAGLGPVMRFRIWVSARRILPNCCSK